MSILDSGRAKGAAACWSRRKEARGGPIIGKSAVNLAVAALRKVVIAFRKEMEVAGLVAFLVVVIHCRFIA